jgi:hypothetical protein
MDSTVRSILNIPGISDRINSTELFSLVDSLRGGKHCAYFTDINTYLVDVESGLSNLGMPSNYLEKPHALSLSEFCEMPGSIFK